MIISNDNSAIARDTEGGVTNYPDASSWLGGWRSACGWKGLAFLVRSEVAHSRKELQHENEKRGEETPLPLTHSLTKNFLTKSVLRLTFLITRRVSGVGFRFHKSSCVDTITITITISQKRQELKKPFQARVKMDWRERIRKDFARTQDGASLSACLRPTF